MVPYEITKLNKISYATSHKSEPEWHPWPSYFHGSCWFALKDYCVADSEEKQLLALCASLIPVFTLPVGNPIFDDGFVLNTALSRLASERNWREKSISAFKPTNKKLGENMAFFHRIWKILPLELQAQIWNSMPLSDSRSFISVMAHIKPLLANVNASNLPSLGVINLKGSLTAYLTRIRGSVYICGLDDGRTLAGHLSETRQEVQFPGTVTIIKVTIGVYGLHSIEFFVSGQYYSLGDFSNSTWDSKWMIAYRNAYSSIKVEWDVSVKSHLLLLIKLRIFPGFKSRHCYEFGVVDLYSIYCMLLGLGRLFH